MMLTQAVNPKNGSSDPVLPESANPYSYFDPDGLGHGRLDGEIGLIKFSNFAH